MADHTEAQIAQPVHVDSGPNPLVTPEVSMVILTWVTFFLLFGILKKFAWKPILKALDDRESAIRKSIVEAEKIREEYMQIGDKRKQVLLEADTQAKDILTQSRQAALKSAKLLEEKAKSDIQIMLENAQREIEAEQENAEAYLRVKSADAAVALAERILRENLNAEKQKKITDTLINEI